MARIKTDKAKKRITGKKHRGIPFKSLLAKHSKSKSIRKTKKRRFKPGVTALREIRKYQRTCDLILPKVTFRRVVREIAHNVGGEKTYRFAYQGMLALQEAAEAVLIKLLSNSNLAAFHAKRVTITKKDILLVNLLRDEFLEAFRG